MCFKTFLFKFAVIVTPQTFTQLMALQPKTVIGNKYQMLSITLQLDFGSISEGSTGKELDALNVQPFHVLLS
jgi:hypothetical protein